MLTTNILVKNNILFCFVIVSSPIITDNHSSLPPTVSDSQVNTWPFRPRTTLARNTCCACHECDEVMCLASWAQTCTVLWLDKVLRGWPYVIDTWTNLYLLNPHVACYIVQTSKWTCLDLDRLATYCKHSAGYFRFQVTSLFIVLTNKMMQCFLLVLQPSPLQHSCPTNMLTLPLLASFSCDVMRVSCWLLVSSTLRYIFYLSIHQ